MNRDERKLLAQQTLDIIKTGIYTTPEGTVVDIKNEIAASRENSRLIRPADGQEMVSQATAAIATNPEANRATLTVTDQSTLAAASALKKETGPSLGILNFASAKNAGGGFLNGAMAQEESLAFASNLYGCQIRHAEYYDTNRQCRSMIYTDYAIFSPDILFFRDDAGVLQKEPLRADVLTLPAVNFGQVLQKGEDTEKAKQAMYARMRLSLAIFWAMDCRNLVLGAYGCGVFRNDPQDVARWWQQLLKEEGYDQLFETIVFAVLDRSKSQACLRAFQNTFG